MRRLWQQWLTGSKGDHTKHEFAGSTGNAKPAGARTTAPLYERLYQNIRMYGKIGVGIGT